jgi:hypothetical protein
MQAGRTAGYPPHVRIAAKTHAGSCGCPRALARYQWVLRQPAFPPHSCIACICHRELIWSLGLPRGLAWPPHAWHVQAVFRDQGIVASMDHETCRAPVTTTSSHSTITLLYSLAVAWITRRVCWRPNSPRFCQRIGAVLINLQTP